MINATEKRLFREKDAAEYLGVSNDSLKTSRYTNILMGIKPPKHVRVGTRSIFYKREDLDEWVDSLGDNGEE